MLINNSILPKISKILLKQFKNSYQFGKIITATKKITQQNNNKFSPDQIKGYDIFKFYEQSKQRKVNHIIDSKIKQQQNLTQQQKCYRLIDQVNNIKVSQYMRKLNSDYPIQSCIQNLNHLHKTRLIPLSLQLLISLPSYKSRQKSFLSRIFTLTIRLIKNTITQGKRHQIPFEFFKQFMKSFNQYFILLDLEVNLVLDYVFLTNNMLVMKAVDSNRSYFINQKIIIDYILDNKNIVIERQYNKNKTIKQTDYINTDINKNNTIINQRDIYTLINYTSLAFITAHYPMRFKQLMHKLIEWLDPQWYKNQRKFQLKNILSNLYHLKYTNQKIMKGLEYILTQNVNNKNFNIYVHALRTYLNLNSEIYPGVKIPQNLTLAITKLNQYIVNTKNITKRFQKQKQQGSIYNIKQYSQQQILYSTLIPLFFRASIYHIQFWTNFIQWLQKPHNYKSIQIIHLYTIFQLVNIQNSNNNNNNNNIINNNIIPKQLCKRILLCKNNLLLKQNVKFDDIDLKRLYLRQYGDNISTNYTLQQQFANNLRSVSLANVKNQVLIKFFIVDILLNETTVIEINNEYHYIYDEQTKQKKLDLKSKFRKRILQKLGYDFLDIQVAQFAQGNYAFLKMIQSKNFGNKNMIRQNQNVNLKKDQSQIKNQNTNININKKEMIL